MFILGWTGPNVPSPPGGMEAPKEPTPEPNNTPSTLLTCLLALGAIAVLVGLAVFVRQRESARQDEIDQTINLGSEQERAEIRTLIVRNREAIERLKQEKSEFLRLLKVDAYEREIRIAALRVGEDDSQVWNGTRTLSDQAGIRRRISPEGLTDVPATLNAMRQLNHILNDLLGQK